MSIDIRCNCYAIISKADKRAEIWRNVVGDDLRVPLKHPIPVNMNGPNGIMSFYEGDPSKLTKDQWTTLSLEMNKKFGVPLQLVIDDLKKGILPIKAENCTVFWCEHHSRLAL